MCAHLKLCFRRQTSVNENFEIFHNETLQSKRRWLYLLPGFKQVLSVILFLVHVTQDCAFDQTLVELL